MSDDAEIERLRLENERLKANLAVAEGVGSTQPRRRVRRTVAAILAFATALLLVLSVVASWTSNTALDTQKFVSRVGPVIDQPAVQSAVATELSQQLVSVLDVQARLTPVLPPNLAFLAGPLASGVDDVVNKAVVRVVGSPAFRKVWYAALTLSHEQVVKLLTGKDSNIQIVQGKVVVDLSGVIALVLQNLQAQLPTIFGTAVSLQVPDNLPVDQIRALVERFLGVQLPPTFAELPVMDATALDNARTGVRVVNLSVLLVLVITLVVFVLALVASTNRRRTLLQIGLWTAGITALIFFVARGVSSATLAGISDDTLRPAVTAAVRELFSTLRGFAALLFWLGLALALVMYLAGPGRLPVRLRGWVRQGYDWTSQHVRAVGESEGYASWTARHLDILRVGGVVVAAVLLFFLQSWWALVVIGIVLVLYEVGVTLYARSTPVASAEADEAVDAPVV